MKKIKYLMAVILTICIVTAPCYIVFADNIGNNEVNVSEDNSQDIIYHIDAVTHEVTV